MARDATEAEVLSFLRDRHPAHYELAVWIRRAVLAADPDLTERVFPGWNGVGFRHPDAGYLCAIYPRSGWVVLHFEHGAALPDPDGILLGDGSMTRFVRIDEPSAELERQITLYVQQAIAERLLR